jgi:hypothetical protein
MLVQLVLCFTTFFFLLLQTLYAAHFFFFLSFNITLIVFFDIFLSLLAFSSSSSFASACTLAASANLTLLSKSVRPRQLQHLQWLASSFMILLLLQLWYILHTHFHTWALQAIPQEMLTQHKIQHSLYPHPCLQ